jgi:antibiotic biosynthesis monooxygenase (ABM) superfamily enzyme
MNPLPSNAAGTPLEVRGARASSVIVQRVPAHAADTFLDWQRAITVDAAKFPGYQTTEIYPPSNEQNEWVIILHFDDSQSLQAWLDSPERAEWMTKLPHELGSFRLKMLPSGFGAWFAGLGEDGRLPAHGKVILSVLLGLYPVVMLLTILLSPYTVSWFGLAIALLISNALGVVILEWGTPALNRFLLARWLRARGRKDQRVTLIGTAAILAALGVMAALFRLVTG